jgi:hypothetical protein
MYDAYSGDSNNVPREGCAISTNWIIPNTSEWGSVKNTRFGSATGPYFRTAIHETGHAMGLYHNTIDNGFMNATNVIAANSLRPGSPPFPDNIQWKYNPEDARRLSHMPDIYVRPGGTPFGDDYITIPISPPDLDIELTREFKLNVSPLHESVPLGAPVRVNIALINTDQLPRLAPESLSFKTNMVRGKVVDPSGTIRTFAPLVLGAEEHPLRLLDPKKSIRNSLTLLRGGQGALFPMPGLYTIQVEVRWSASPELEAVVRGQTNILVTGVESPSHAKAALKILSTPDTLLTLILGGDHLKEGIDAISVALNDPTLQPHYAFTEAKRLGQTFGHRKANLEAVAKLIKVETVMSPAEIKKAASLTIPARGALRLNAAKLTSAGLRSATTDSTMFISKILEHKLNEIKDDEFKKEVSDHLHHVFSNQQ